MNCDSIWTRRLYIFARLKEPANVKKTRSERCNFHQPAHVTEVIQERFSGYNEAEQLKAPRGVVADHCPILTGSSVQWTSKQYA